MASSRDRLGGLGQHPALLPGERGQDLVEDRGPSVKDPFGGGRAALGQPDRDAASVRRIDAPGGELSVDKCIDDSHGAGVANTEPTGERVDRSAVGPTMEGGERGCLGPLPSRCVDCVPHPVGHEEDRSADDVGVLINRHGSSRRCMPGAYIPS